MHSDLSSQPIPCLKLLDLYTATCGYVQGNTKIKVGIAMRLLVECLGDLAAAQIQALQVGQFQTFLRNRVTDRGRRMSEHSVNSYCAAAAQAFTWGVAVKLVAVNPFDGMHKLKAPKRQVAYYRPDRIAALLDGAGRFEAEDPTARLRWTAILLCGLAGMRSGAIQNTRWDDIDLEAGVITVRWRPDQPGEFWEWGDKGRADYVVPIAQDLLECLYRMQVACPWRYPMLPRRTCASKQGRVGSLTEAQRKQPYNNFRRTWLRIKAAGKVEAGVFHDLRKTTGTHLCRERVPLPMAQLLLGHKDMATTRLIYTAVEREECLSVGRAAYDKYRQG